MIRSFIINFISDDDVFKQLISIINSTNDVSFSRNSYIFVKSVFLNLFISKILRSCSISQFSIFNFDNDSNISDDVINRTNVHDVIFKNFIIFTNWHNSIFRDFINISLIFSQLFNLIRLFFNILNFSLKFSSAVLVFFSNSSAFLWINVKLSFLFRRSRLAHFKFWNVLTEFQHMFYQNEFRLILSKHEFF